MQFFYTEKFTRSFTQSAPVSFLPHVLVYLYRKQEEFLHLSVSPFFRLVVCDVRTCSRIPDLETAGRRRAGTAGAAKRQPLLCL